MKKIVLTAFGLLAGLALTAAEQNQFITFSTKGPDRYADGSTVLDGECYALVKVAKDKTFAGFLANGQEVDKSTGLIALTAPIARSGCCPTTMFQVDEEHPAAKLSGTWAIYLLDTRVVNNGVTRPAGVGADGYAKAVNASGVAADGESGNFVSVKTAIAGTDKSVLPEGVAKPVIKSIRIEGGKVYVTASATTPFVQYALASGDDAAKFTVGDQVENGKAEDIVFVTDKAEGTQIFKVVGK